MGPASAPSTCQKPIKTSSLPSAQVRALGVHQVGQVVQFDVPAGTGTISIVSQASSGVVDSVTYKGEAVDNLVLPTALKTPSGAVLYDIREALPTDPATANVWSRFNSPVTAIMTLPNTTKALADFSSGYPAGRWSLTVDDLARECATTPNCSGGSTSGTYDVTVLLKPVAPSTGTVDLALYLVTSSLTAAAAMTDAYVQRFLSTLAILYGRAGLCLGTITFYDVPSWARMKWATGVDATKTGPCDELDQMFTLSQPGNTLNFFLVDDLIQSSTPSGGKVVGIDGAIPGPSSVGGTVHSGAVVNFADYAKGTAGCTGAPSVAKCAPDFTAYITAHEGGHWMGLYHPTEGVGAIYDPIADTAKCTCSTACGVMNTTCCYDPTKALPTQCADKPVLLDDKTCSRGTTTCGGADLLMFYTIYANAVGNLSAQEAAVIRANPVVR